MICLHTRNLYILSSNFEILSRPLYLLALHKPFANLHGNFQSLIYLSWRKQLRTSFPQTWGQESQACCNYLELGCCPSYHKECVVQRNNVEEKDVSGLDSSRLDNPLWERKTNHNKVNTCTTLAAESPRKIGRRKETPQTALRFFDLLLIQGKACVSPVLSWSNRFFTVVHDHLQELLSISMVCCL